MFQVASPESGDPTAGIPATASMLIPVTPTPDAASVTLATSDCAATAVSLRL